MGRTAFIDLAGRCFHRLTAVSRTFKEGDRRTYWLCRCECGQHVVVEGGTLRAGRQQSCGCKRVEACRQSFTTHGASRQMTREYRSWRNAKSRCFDPGNIRYAQYGGRGITMCARWRDDFAAFLADMGQCPPDCSLDRRDPRGDYEPNNARRATKREQANNLRASVYVTTAGGHRLTVADAARAFGVTYHGLYQAVIVRGEMLEQALEHLPTRQAE